MLYSEIMAVCSQIHKKHINTLCGQSVELLNVKLAVHIVTTGLQRVKNKHCIPPVNTRNSWDRTDVQTLTVAQPVKNVPLTASDHKPNESCQHPHSLFLWCSISIYKVQSPYLCLDLPKWSSLQRPLLQCTNVSSPFQYHSVNPLKAELNPICHFLALFGAHHILHVSR